MSIRRAVLLAMLFGTMAAVLGSATLARADDPTPLPPDQAQALATAPGDSGSTTSVVDGNTALDASSLSGADTSIEAGVSRRQPWASHL